MSEGEWQQLIRDMLSLSFDAGMLHGKVLSMLERLEETDDD
jgi:hypothetical protein